eukprot:gene10765-10921_t
MAPRDPILGVTEKFLADQNPNKINLGVGAYRDDNGQPVVLESVRHAEQRVAGSHFMEYLPIGGLRDFVTESVKLAYGDDSPAIKGNVVAAVQSLSGTGSCRLFAEFQRRFLPHSTVYIPVPTWANHHNIWRDAGVAQKTYRYYKAETRGLDLDGLLEDLNAAPNGSVILLHACAHNPTGVDPTPEQWAAVSKLMKYKSHFPFFDMAYQGFASGDCNRDALAIRTFVADGHQVGLSQSYAKNMGLYGQRVGCFSLVCSSPAEAAKVESQMKLIARPMYSNPPLHGALLVSTILHDADLKQQWYQEVAGMADRIKDMRHLLRSNLEQLGSPHDFSYLEAQIGMFAYTGLTGGCLQHAQGLLSLLDGSSVGNGPNSERSISTTRGIYMGRVFIRENLAKSATKSRLFTRENYQYLVSNGWSLAACEQVLQNHQQARSDKQKNSSAVWKALLQTITSTTTLAALQQVVADHGHRMNNVNISVVIQQVPKVMMRSAGTPDYTGAALLLDQMASRLLPVMDHVSGPNICMDLAAFSRCRYSPKFLSAVHSWVADPENLELLQPIGLYCNPSFTAALEAAVQRLLQVQQLTAPTAMAAAWAASRLQQPRTQLLQPAFLAAMTEPDSFHGLMCGRLLKVTADLPSDVMQEQEQKLREELHRLSGSRGPVPDAAPGNAPWVDSIAEKTHAHMFTKFVDMEMVAGAFERMNYKEGLPALKALQEQTMRMPQP